MFTKNVKSLISDMSFFTYKKIGENKKNSKNFEHFTNVVNSYHKIQIENLDQRELQYLKKSALLAQYGDKFLFDEDILPSFLDCSKEILNQENKNMTVKIAKESRAPGKLKQKNIDETVEEHGGKVIKHYQQDTGKFASILDFSDSTKPGVCLGFSIQQLIEFSKGKTIDTDMRVVSKENGKSKIKISKVNEICKLQIEANEKKKNMIS
ncbi:hypothetical protein GWK90_09245 [Candidatus Hamiltonella defensa]|uniref:Uncharacterized protein n=2 Tax=Candidatus Williamhamiltonella defendens TaxID=138072 RepID=C4K5Q3_HAMD5|nr:hypothetical protein [Candidatus Hamiltonella defensa]ACQ67896.1 hypothetical protein HDEF_1239 [Candidatus Hamiltonella defensa 5AT (Acyrthosiphon pisum)]MBK4362344.1 hypothetical protein [Candidatus Hamiltonella defensa]